MRPYQPPPTPPRDREDISGDVEVWKPPLGDPKMWLPSHPCPHCGDEYWHIWSCRCMGCGRRAPLNAQGEITTV